MCDRSLSEFLESFFFPHGLESLPGCMSCFSEDGWDSSLPGIPGQGLPSTEGPDLGAFMSFLAEATRQDWTIVSSKASTVLKLGFIYMVDVSQAHVGANVSVWTLSHRDRVTEHAVGVLRTHGNMCGCGCALH
jgi:hypothetical protein